MSEGLEDFDFEAFLSKFKHLIPTDGETYCLRKITEWLGATGTPKSDYSHASSNPSKSLYSSGIKLKLNDELRLSIQTDPLIAGPAFCETALVNDSGLLSDGLLGYYDVLRWDEPEDLFQHIVEVRQKLKDKDAEDTPECNTSA